MDRSAFVCEPHLSAALALWNYAEASAKFIFGDALCDSLADEILGKLRIHPLGLSRTDISSSLGRNRRGQDIDRALHVLEERGLAWKHVEKGHQGRPVERWAPNMSTN